MKKYLLDFCERKLSADEAEEYFKYDVIEMYKSGKDISIYLEIENDYIKFFKNLFEINNYEVEIVFKNFSIDLNTVLFDEEKIYFEKFLRNLKFEELFFKRVIKLTKFEELEILIKLAYRNLWEYPWLRMEFGKLKIKVDSLYYYCFVMILNRKKDIDKLNRISENLKIYIKDLGN